MKWKLTVVLLACAALAALAGGAAAKGLDLQGRYSADDWVPPPPEGGDSSNGTRLDTFWIYYADFEDGGAPENQWMSFDRSGTVGQTNYWHKDTIRPKFAGDSTWWCGTYSACWRQPRGYGNGWIQYLYRDFPLSSWSSGGQAVDFEFDQRFAIEHDYDYGYVDVSTDGGSTWTSLQTFTNPGFAGKPGVPQDWNSTVFPGGHFTIDMAAYAGIDIRLRYRFESDLAYSSADQFDNQAHSVKDGAWQVDNFEWTVEGGQVFYDDSQAPGNNGWVNEDLVATGQTGYVFFRGLYGTDFDTGRPFTCENREGWMLAAVEPFSGKVVDNEATWVISPPIDISGAPKLVGKWDYWLDCPEVSKDRYDLWLASHDLKECVQELSGFVDENPGGWYGGPYWNTKTDDWDAFAGNDWLSIMFKLWNDEPATPGTHMAGLFINWARVGIPTGDAGITWNYGTWERFHDWFKEQLVTALGDSAVISIKDDDGIASATLMASNDEGASWSQYAMVRPAPESNDWYAPPPDAEMTAGSTIRYYFEAEDEVGTTSVFPEGAPDSYYTFSILPLTATVSNPGILLVDKHGRLVPGECRDNLHSSQYYYVEALGILGYEWEVFDVDVPSGTNEQSDGPDSAGYKYYDTQIWWANRFDAYTIKTIDQFNIIQWLSVANPPAKQRNLLITGENVGYELVQAQADSHDLYDLWLASNWLEDSIGDPTVDSLPTLRPASADWGSWGAWLAGGCPDPLERFDVIEPLPVGGASTAFEYLLDDMSTKPAAVAYEHETFLYKTMNCGFGVEYMMDTQFLPNGCYKTGISQRVALIDSVMKFFEKYPTAIPTDVPVAGLRNELSQAYPNPFNPVTKIAYTVREAGPVTIEVHNVAGRVVRTLLEAELEAGESGHVVWDGRNGLGEQCASGVYFYRIQAPGFATTKKMVMLK